MPKFRYSAKSVDGSHNTNGGIVEAANEEAAIKEAKKKYAYAVDVTIIDMPQMEFAAPPPAPKHPLPAGLAELDRLAKEAGIK